VFPSAELRVGPRQVLGVNQRNHAPEHDVFLHDAKAALRRHFKSDGMHRRQEGRFNCRWDWRCIGHRSWSVNTFDKDECHPSMVQVKKFDNDEGIFLERTDRPTKLPIS